jgi:hypothetical protein
MLDLTFGDFAAPPAFQSTLSKEMAAMRALSADFQLGVFENHPHGGFFFGESFPRVVR